MSLFSEIVARHQRVSKLGDEISLSDPKKVTIALRYVYGSGGTLPEGYTAYLTLPPGTLRLREDFGTPKCALYDGFPNNIFNRYEGVFCDADGNEMQLSGRESRLLIREAKKVAYQMPR